MGLGFGGWRRALVVGSVLDDGEGLTVRRVLDDREMEWGRRRGRRRSIIGFEIPTIFHISII